MFIEKKSLYNKNSIIVPAALTDSSLHCTSIMEQCVRTELNVINREFIYL